MKIKLIELSGFVSCFNTLRKPHKLENRSEGHFCVVNPREVGTQYQVMSIASSISICNKDLELLQKLIKAGDEHAKALRLIDVTLEINGPLYFWNEMDTYEIGVTNGCSESTMHTLKKEKLTDSHFERPVGEFTLNGLQKLIDDDFSIDVIKGALPSGYLQKRDIKISYQTLQRIYKQRSTHRLDVWRQFCEFIKTLPLSNELIIMANENTK